MKKGWIKWPIITMDTANNPLYSEEARKLGLSWCNEIARPMLEAGFNYTRYYVGGLPPEDEQRFSTPECDDARNGLGAYGGISFIIESGLKRRAENQNSDLGYRIKAYLELFNQLLLYADKDQNLLRDILEKGSRFPDSFIPTNYFWANPGSKISGVKVLDTESGKPLTISTANFMHEIVTKKSVTKPDSYIIAAEAETLFTPLLQKHGLRYDALEKADSIMVEPCRLVQVETFHDSVYQRYAGRQIVFSEPPTIKYFNRGSIIVPLSQEFVRKVIILLEPNMMYGLYKHKDFSNLADRSQILPVYRITDRKGIK
jgi:hypothetical protein